MELSSKEDLSKIALELKGKIYPLQNDVEKEIYYLAFECSLNEDEPKQVIEEFIELLNSLTGVSKKLLANCHQKVLDIGYESGEEGAITNTLSNALLTRVVEYGFDINVTLYPVDKSDEQENS